MTIPAPTTPQAEGPLDILRRIAGKTGDLPPLPATALAALRMTDDPRISARELQSVISRDQALTARILRIVNSPLYGLRAEVSTVSHAVAIIGLATLRSIIVAATVQQVFHGSKVLGHDLTTKLLADHSWGAAVAARKVAARIRYPKLEEAFLCGLMHDIGKIVMLKNYPARYSDIISDVYRGAGDFQQCENEVFGFGHAQVGALVAERWNFPPQLWEAIGFHHEPLSAPTYAQLACVTGVADSLMIALELGFQRNAKLDVAMLPATTYLRLSRSTVEELIAELRAAHLPETSPLKT